MDPSIVGRRVGDSNMSHIFHHVYCLDKSQGEGWTTISEYKSIECCGSKTHQILQNMIISRGLELKLCREGQLS